MEQKMKMGILAIVILVAAVAFFLGNSIDTPLGEAMASKVKPKVCIGDVVIVCDKKMKTCFEVVVDSDSNAIRICGGGGTTNTTNTTAINNCAVIMAQPGTGTLGYCGGGGGTTNTTNTTNLSATCNWNYLY